MRISRSSSVLRRCRVLVPLCLSAMGVISCDGQHTAGVAGRPSHAAAATSAAVKGPGTPTVDHALMDAAWDVPYGTVKLPAGWAFNGGVVHGGGGCFAMGDSPMWSAESADKRYGIAMLPMLKTSYTSDGNLMRQMEQSHCPTMRSSSAADYLTQYVLPHLHGAGGMRIVATGQEPQLAPVAEQFRQQSAQLERIGNNQYQRMHAKVETARVLVQYQEGGKTMNEVASALFVCNDTQMAFPGMGRTEMLDCTAPLTVIGHGPEDGTPFTNEYVDAHSKDPAFFTMTQSDVWQQRFNQKMQQAAEAQQQQTRQILAQGQQNMRNQQAQFDAGQARYHQQQQGYDQYNNAWKARQQAQDQTTQGFVHYLSGTNVYTNAQTGQQYEMSNQYNNTYVNQSGTVGLQTNSASSPGVDWTLLTPKY